MQNIIQSGDADPAPRRALPAILIATAYPSLLTWMYFIALAEQPSVVQQSAYTGGKAIQFGFPIVWSWFYCRDAVGWPKLRIAGLIEGLLFGAMVATAMLVTYRFWLHPAGFFDSAIGPIQAKVNGLGIHSPGAFILLGISYAVAHSLMEEYYWRWFVFARLAASARLPIAIAISSLGFMAHHVLVIGAYFGWTSASTWLFSFAVAVGGAVWAWLYHRSGSLVGPWLSHLLVDAAIFAIGYDLIFNQLA